LVGTIRILAALLLIGLPAQTKRPDFSGSWSLQSGAGGHGSTLLFSGKAMTVEQTATSITVKRLQGQDAISMTVPLDGREQTIQFPPARGGTEPSRPATVKSTAAWHDNELVVTTTQEVVSQRSGEKGKLEQKETLTLIAPGVLLVRRTYSQVVGASGDVVNEQDVYKLAPSSPRKGGGEFPIPQVSITGS